MNQFKPGDIVRLSHVIGDPPMDGEFTVTHATMLNDTPVIWVDGKRSCWAEAAATLVSSAHTRDSSGRVNTIIGIVPEGGSE